MIQIKKEEAKELNKLGVPFGEYGISRSHKKTKSKYYLCESKENLDLYAKIKK